MADNTPRHDPEIGPVYMFGRTLHTCACGIQGWTTARNKVLCKDCATKRKAKQIAAYKQKQREKR